MSKDARSPFLTDLEAIRRRALARMAPEQGLPGRPRHGTVVALLNDAVAAEIACVLRWERHRQAAASLDRPQMADLFLEHAREEREHVDRLVTRIRELGAEPDLSQEDLLSWSLDRDAEPGPLANLLREDLEAELIAVLTYREMTAYVRDRDAATTRLLRGILAQEEAHASELSDLVTRSGFEAAAPPAGP